MATDPTDDGDEALVSLGVLTESFADVADASDEAMASDMKHSIEEAPMQATEACSPQTSCPCEPIAVRPPSFFARVFGRSS